MNTIEFVENVPANQLAMIFKDYFEQHMFTYNLLKGTQFIKLNSVNINTASIMYSVKLLEQEDKDKLVALLKSHASSLVIYGKSYTPEIFINGDLLCITIKR